MFIHFKNIEEIYIEGSTSIYSEDTIIFKNLRIENKGDYSTWDLKINAESVKIFLHAVVGEIRLEGRVEKLYLYSSGTNHCYLEKLNCNEVSINHSSLGDIHLYVIESLNLDINASGNFYCYGNPPYQLVSIEENKLGRLFFVK